MGARAWVVGFVLARCWSAVTADDRLRVGVWNIERLSATARRGFPELRGGEALPPRADADLQRMATYIRDELDVGALMISEVEADSPDSTETRPQSQQLNRLVQKLGSNWRYFLGRTGGEMRLGLLFNTDRVRLKKLVNLHAPTNVYSPLPQILTRLGSPGFGGEGRKRFGLVESFWRVFSGRARPARCAGGCCRRVLTKSMPTCLVPVGHTKPWPHAKTAEMPKDSCLPA